MILDPFCCGYDLRPCEACPACGAPYEAVVKALLEAQVFGGEPTYVIDQNLPAKISGFGPIRADKGTSGENEK
jgi:hypothetical protein